MKIIEKLDFLKKLYFMHEGVSLEFRNFTSTI
jgi:hypothetical protein